MASIFLKTPVYITAEEVKDTTTKTGLLALSDDSIKILITKAQEMVDNYIISYWKKFDEGQSYIFPVDINWISTLPEDIKIATFYCVEQIFENGDTIKWSVTTTWTWAISSERTWDRTISYDVWTSTTEISNTAALWLPNEAIQILKKYRKTFYVTKI